MTLIENLLTGLTLHRLTKPPAQDLVIERPSGIAEVNLAILLDPQPAGNSSLDVVAAAYQGRRRHPGRFDVLRHAAERRCRCWCWYRRQSRRRLLQLCSGLLG